MTPTTIVLLAISLLISAAASIASLLSLYFEYRFWRGRGRVVRLSKYPSVTVIVPIRGVDQNLEGNVRSILSQDYDGPVKFVFVLDDLNDPAYRVIEGLVKNLRNVKVVLSQGAGKGYALSTGLKYADTDVVVFADSDIYVHGDWLRALVNALKLGFLAATTYRFYVPLRRINAASLLRASFNMIGFTAMQSSASRFTWGGSTAIWRWLLDKYNVEYYLKHYLSDDYVLTHIVHREGGSIAFIPEATVLTLEDVGLRDAFNWSVRQLWYVKVYGFRGFELYIGIYTVYAITLPLAVASFIASGQSAVLAIGLLPYVVGVFKDFIRVSGLRGLGKFYESKISVKYAALLALTSIPNVYFSWFASMKTLATKRINWRGRVFDEEYARLNMLKNPLP